MTRLTIVAPPPVELFADARDAAWLAVVVGYEEALTRLHPCDAEKRAWFRARLRDARTAAGLAPVELARGHRLAAVETSR